MSARRVDPRPHARPSTRPPRRQASGSRLRLYLGLAHRGPPGILAFAFLCMTLFTWLRWPDPLIDYGQTLYVAWQLEEGKVLYRDIAYLFGPLSPYVNALIFRIAGEGALWLALCNLAVLAAMIAMLFAILKQIGGRFAATAGCLSLITITGFGQLVRIGNFNFVMPYTPEITHGLALSIAAILCFLRYQRTARVAWLFVAGFALGLVFLTKPEIFVALAGGLGVGLVVDVWRGRASGESRLSRVACFAAAAMIAPLAAFILLWTAMPMDQAVKGALGAWLPALEPNLTGLPFYKKSMGTDDVLANLRALLTWSAAHAALIGAAVAAAFALGRATRRAAPRLLAAVAAAGCAFGLVWWFRAECLSDGARPLPLYMLAAAAIAGIQLLRRPVGADDRDARRNAGRLIVAVFALLMLLKVLLRARLFHYGFAVATPALLVLAAIWTQWIPRWINRRGGAGVVVRVVGVGILAATALSAIQLTAQWHALKIFPVGRGADAFVADERGGIIDQAVAIIDERLPPPPAPEATIAALPEGVMINYLSRRTNPTPYISYLPSDMAVFGEASMLDALQAAPPDCIVLTHRLTSEFGLPVFGRDYARDILAWIRANYREMVVVGDPPFQTERFGVMVLVRSSLQESPAEPTLAPGQGAAGGGADTR